MHLAVLLAHLLGASIWVGGHLILVFAYLPRALRTKELGALQAFEARFERVGIPALVLQVLTGLWLAWNYVPDVGRWFAFEDPFGRVVGIKLSLLLATGLLAADARLRIIPRLTRDNLGSLAWHIVPVTLVAVALVVFGALFRFGGI